MKLRRLKILKFRNVQPGTELEFNDGYNVLLGQNGSGKTTLLRLITSVLRGDFRWLEREEKGFGLAANLEMDSIKLAFAITHEPREQPKHLLDILPSHLRAYIPPNETWSTTIDFHLDIRGTGLWHWSCDDNGSRMTLPGWSVPAIDTSRRAVLGPIFPSVLGELFLTFALENGNVITSALVSQALQEPFLRISDTCRFDESLDLFSAITNRTSPLGAEEFGYAMGKSQTTSMIPALPATTRGNLVPTILQAHEALKTPNFDAPIEAITVRHNQASFLDKVAQMLGYAGAEMKLDLLGKEVTGTRKTLEYGNLRFFFHGRDGSIVNQDHLSYGQKRLLTFFYYLACNPHVVVADELVNGLHHAWIAECIKEMGDRQVFVTSQNPILLDHLGFDSAEQVRRTFITCQAKPEGVRDRIFWANMTKKNADSFYRAYKVGAQHVGEILRTKGFW